jgi:hypothetical protein
MVWLVPRLSQWGGRGFLPAFAAATGPAANKEVISEIGSFFKLFWKRDKACKKIEWFREIKTADQWGTCCLVNRKTADDGITKSKQLKCIFDAQFFTLYIYKYTLTNLKDAHSSKIHINFYDSGAILIVCIFCKFIPMPMPRSTDYP